MEILKCEYFTKKILPNIKKELAYVLYTKYNLPQTDIAKKLLITQASISQYFSGKRCKYNYTFSDEELSIINKITEELANNNKSLKDMTDYLCKLCEISYKKELSGKIKN